MADIFEIAGRIHSTSQEEVVTVADEILDSNKNKKQSNINAEVDATLAEHTSTIQGLNSQNYETYTATDQTTAETDVLPAEGSEDTIYRLGNWDGNQYDVTCYSEYSWNGSAYVHISTKTQIGEVFDISAYHASGGELAKYADLAAALGNNGENIPQPLRKGGMSVKYVQSSDNKYVQARLMAQSFSTIITDWQVVDDTPIMGSENIITSGGVFDALTVGTEEEIDLSDYQTLPIFPDNNKWVVGYLNYSGKLIPIEPNKKYKIKGGSYNGKFLFTTSDQYSDLSPIPYATGSTTTTINAGETIIVDAPVDAHYLYVATNNNVNDITPEYVGLYDKTKVVDILGDVDDVPIDGSEKFVKSGGVKSSINSVQNEIYKTFINVLNPANCTSQTGGLIISEWLNVKEGEKYIFNAQGYLYNIVYSIDGSTTEQELTLDANEPFVIPSGINYMRYRFSYFDGWQNYVVLIKGEELPADFITFGEHKVYNLLTNEDYLELEGKIDGVQEDIYKAYNNVLNPNNCTAESGGYILSEWISVHSGETYIFNKQGWQYNIIYSIDGIHSLRQLTLTANEPFTIPFGINYMRYRFSSFTDWDKKTMLIKGDELPPYFVPFGEFKDYKLVAEEEFYDGPFINVLNPAACTENADVSNNNINNLQTATGFCISEKIAVSEGEVYIFNHAGWNGNIYLSQDDVSCTKYEFTAGIPFTIPSGCVSMRYRFTIDENPYKDGKWRKIVMLLKGSTMPSYYVNYGTTPKVAKVDKIVRVPDYLLPNEKKAICLLNFDGINKPTFDFIAPYLHSLGLPFTVFCGGTNFSDTGEPASGNPPYWSIEDVIYAINNYGMELGVYTNQTSGITASYYTQFQEIKASIDALKNKGFYNIRCSAYSGGRHNEVNESILKNCFGIQVARTTDAGIHYHSRDAFNIKCKTLGDSNYASTIISDVDSIISSKQCIAPLTHGLYMPEYVGAFCADPTYNTSEENMKTAFDYIAEKVALGQLTCMTFSQYVQWLTLPDGLENDTIAYTKLPNSKCESYWMDYKWEKIN